MRKTRPQVELEALVYLVQAAAEVAGVLADREGVCARGDFDAVKIALDVARQTAAVAGNDEADALGVGDVGFYRRPAHHDDVRVAQTLCDVLRKVKAVARAGIAEYNVFAHN